MLVRVYERAYQIDAERRFNETKVIADRLAEVIRVIMRKPSF